MLQTTQKQCKFEIGTNFPINFAQTDDGNRSVGNSKITQSHQPMHI